MGAVLNQEIPRAACGVSRILLDKRVGPGSLGNQSVPRNHLSAQPFECPQKNSLPDFPHSVKVKVKVMVRGENCRQDFPGLK